MIRAIITGYPGLGSGMSWVRVEGKDLDTASDSQPSWRIPSARGLKEHH